MNNVAIGFISFQTTLEILIFFFHIRYHLHEEWKLVTYFSYFWIYQFFQVFITYTASAFYDPGYLPRTWISQVQNDPEYKEELAETGEKNFCEQCIQPRPLRCHHCSDCNKCVLLYDHHCFFIDNCVGKRNFKVFFQFLWGFVVHAGVTMFIVFYNISTHDPDAFQLFTMMIGLLYFPVFSFFVIFQLFPQVGFLFHNSTWVEDSMRDKQKEFYQKAKVKQYYAYDHGLIQNLKERLGQNPIQWFLPTPNTDNPYKSRYNPSYVPIHKLHVSLIDNFDENSPLLKKYARKRENAQDMV